MSKRLLVKCIERSMYALFVDVAMQTFAAGVELPEWTLPN